MKFFIMAIATILLASVVEAVRVNPTSTKSLSEIISFVADIVWPNYFHLDITEPVSKTVAIDTGATTDAGWKRDYGHAQVATLPMVVRNFMKWYRADGTTITSPGNDDVKPADVTDFAIMNEANSDKAK